MQYTPENANKVVRREKDNTSRLVKPGDESIGGIGADGKPCIVEVRRNGRSLYRVGKVEAVQPGRGKKGIGFQRTTAIRRERVQEISEEDAKAEGAQGVWVRLRSSDEHGWPEQDVCSWRLGFQELWDSIYAGQPGKQWADNPEVWALTFELVSEQADGKGK